MDRLADVLLRHHLVAPALLASGPVPDLSGSTWRGRRRKRLFTPRTAAGLPALEADLLELGYLLSAPLRRRLADMAPWELTTVGRRLITAMIAKLGGHVEHVPLFRNFPASVPRDTHEFYVRRIFTVLLQEPEQSCVLCGKIATVHPVSPCAHLVCRACWDGSDFSACPICHRRIDPGDPFLRPESDVVAEAAPAPRVRRMTLLALCEDPWETAHGLVRERLSRGTPLRPADLADVTTLLDVCAPRSADWLPDVIPGREAKAAALSIMMTKAPRALPDLLDRHVTTVTDLLRLLNTAMGGDAGLRIRPPRRRSLPRPLRRILLGHIDRLALPHGIEDLHRYGEAWKRMAEALHPHEGWRRHPRAALAFAVLRGTRLDVTTPFGAAMLALATEHPEAVWFDGVRLRARSFAGEVERTLRERDVPAALALLARRPGELSRRLVHLARLAAPGPEVELLGDTLARAARRVSPGVLIGALGALRTPAGVLRVYLPRGGSARMFVASDERPPIPEATVATAISVIESEMLRRAAALPPVELALLDEGLTDLMAPLAERSASGALVRVTRGSVQPIPEGERIRLFLHWAEPAGKRVDLDLSVAVFDERWRFHAMCDYTNLRAEGLTHSGDLTSAPEPLGSSEFVDIEVPELRSRGGRYVVPVVFSYNDVPFDELPRGFAGFMETPRGETFDARAVRQRFDLSGASVVLVPFVADLVRRTLRWVDFNIGAAGYGHDLHAHWDKLARLGSTLEEIYELGERVTLWEVARWHAAARAREVLVRHRDGTTTRHRRAPGESPAAFAARLTASPLSGPPPSEEPGTVLTGPSIGDPTAAIPDFAALIEGDHPVRDGGDVYALHPGTLDPSRVNLLDASALVSLLAPQPSLVPA